MKIVKDLLYARSHEWVKMLDETTALTGISDFAQQSLNEIVFVNLPEPGDEITAGQPYGDIESVKTVSDVLSHVTGVVAEVNDLAVHSPRSINDDPYGCWILKVSGITEKGELMTAEQYESFCAEQQ